MRSPPTAFPGQPGISTYGSAVPVTTRPECIAPWPPSVRLDHLSVKDLGTPDMVFQIGIPPLRVDLLTSISGVAFERAWGNREILSLQGLDVPVLSRQDLIANKRASGRPQDLLDADRLEQRS